MNSSSVLLPESLHFQKNPKEKETAETVSYSQTGKRTFHVYELIEIQL